MAGWKPRMRAAFVPTPGRVEVGEFPTPAAGAGEVLVELAHASVCGSDIRKVFDGFHDPEWLGTPGWPGHEGVGVVVDSHTPAFPPGTGVLTVLPGRSGRCFAEYVAIDAAHVVPLPEGVPAQRLLPAQQLGTTVFALKRFLRHPGTRGDGCAAVIGAGSSGLFFVQQLLRRGFTTVVACDLNADRLREAARLGATHTVLGPAGTSPFVAQVLDATDGRGADLVVEAAGGDDCRRAAVEAARDAGMLGLFGYPQRPGDAPFPVDRAFRKRLTMEWVNGAQSEPGLASFRTALDLIARGEIEVDHCLRTAYPLEDAPAAFAAARAQGHGAAKVNVVLPAGAA
ncbi:zinc-binding dehydrogenase [Streptomyces olivaceiscleroticus]